VTSRHIDDYLNTPIYVVRKNHLFVKC